MDFALPYNQGTGTSPLQNVLQLPLYIYFYDYLINFCHPYYEGSMKTRTMSVLIHYVSMYLQFSQRGINAFVTRESPGISFTLSSVTGHWGVLGTLQYGTSCPLDRWNLGQLLTLSLS